MATPAQGWDRPSRRRGLRYRVQSPVDVTVLRSGIPDTLPGRSLNLGSGGVAAVLAGELVPGETVALEIQLPLTASPLRARALVKYHDRLRSGMEFIGLSAEQQSAIRDWAGIAIVKTETEAPAKPPAEAEREPESIKSGGGEPPIPAPRRWRRRWLLLPLLAAVLIGLFWWRWNRGWEDIELTLPSQKSAEAIQPQANVSADVMEKRIIHRVDPEYPAAARPRNLQGVIVLAVIVGRDGSVVDLRALNGPDVLAQAAKDALRWWRFEPYRVNGQPVVVETTVAVEFKP